jgi:hypothetical protein
VTFHSPPACRFGIPTIGESMRVRFLVLVLGLPGFSMCGVTGAAAGDAAPPPHLLAWVPNGTVDTAVSFRGRLVIGGSFTMIGPRTGQAAAVSSSTGALRPGFPEFAGGAVMTIVSDGRGGSFVGGFFRYADGQPRDGLAHVLADGSVDPHFTPEFDGGVFSAAGATALALSGSTLYVTGVFEHADGSVRHGLAAFDTSTGAVTPWNPRVHGYVDALLASGGTVFAGGSFQTIGGAPRSNLAALDAVTGDATPWNPSAGGEVAALALSGPVLYVGGEFATIGDVSRPGLAALDPVTGALSAWMAGWGGPVAALATDGTTVYVGTGLSELLSLEENHVVGWRGTVTAVSAADGTRDWSVPFDGDVNELAVSRSGMFVAGRFEHAGQSERTGVAELDPATGAVLPFAPRPDLLSGPEAYDGSPREPGEQWLRTGVVALMPAGDQVLIGGNFAAVGGVSRQGLAIIDPGTGRPDAWAPTVAGTVEALAASPTRLYAIGRFSAVGGRARQDAAAFDGRLRLLPWAPRLGDVSAANLHITVFGSKVIVTYLHGGISTFDTRTGRRVAWGPSERGNLAGRVYVLGGRVYVAEFSPDVYKGPATVKLDPATGAPTVLASRIGTGWVEQLALSGGTLYLAGGAVRAVDFANPARVRPWRATTDGNTYALLVRDGAVYVGGLFDRAGSEERLSLAAFYASSDRLLPWNPQLAWDPEQGDGWVDTLAPYSSGFVATGNFAAVAGHAQPFLAVFPD